MKTILGLIAKPLNWFIKPQTNHWVFGSDFGNTYREGTKYLFEYMCSEHPEYICTFITQNPRVQKELIEKGYRCELNNTIKGILAIARADRLFMSQYLTDIRLFYKKRGQKVYYIVHGQPYKKAMKALPEKFKSPKSIWSSIKYVIYDILGGISHVEMKDTQFVAASSDFLAKYMSIDFGGELPHQVIINV